MQILHNVQTSSPSYHLNHYLIGDIDSTTWGHLIVWLLFLYTGKFEKFSFPFSCIDPFGIKKIACIHVFISQLFFFALQLHVRKYASNLFCLPWMQWNFLLNLSHVLICQGFYNDSFRFKNTELYIAMLA